MQNFMKALDGKKRYLMLAVFIGQEVLARWSGHPGSIDQALKMVVGVLGWSPDDAVVSSAVIAQLAAAAYAVYDGIRKDREKRDAIVR